jgi:microcystin-dependent protein
MKKYILTIMAFISINYAFAQSPLIGEIRMFAGSFAPVGWAICDGSLFPINGNEALFSIIGTIYGGDGMVTFALPDLRGRVPVHQGSLAGQTFALGSQSGTEYKNITTANLPPHSHSVSVAVKAGNDEGTSKSPVGNYPAVDGTNLYGTPESGSATSSSPVSVTIQNSGNSIPAENRQPSVAVNYIICLSGYYPTSN